jgi:hypothetical protein
MARFDIVHTPDDRVSCPQELEAGVYYVNKTKCLKRFEFGAADDEFCGVVEAFLAMSEFIQSRPDSQELFVQLIGRRLNK